MVCIRGILKLNDAGSSEQKRGKRLETCQEKFKSSIWLPACTCTDKFVCSTTGRTSVKNVHTFDFWWDVGLIIVLNWLIKKKNHIVPFSVEPVFWILLLSLFLLGTCLGPSTFPSLWWLSSTPWPTSPTSLPWPLRSCCPPTLWQWWAALQLLLAQIFLWCSVKSDASFWGWAVFLQWI